MRTRGQVDGVRTYAETLYQTVPSTAEGVEAFRAASARGGTTARRTRCSEARPAVLRGAGPALRRRVRVDERRAGLPRGIGALLVDGAADSLLRSANCGIARRGTDALAAT